MLSGNIFDLDSGCKTMINGFRKFSAIAALCLCFSASTMSIALAKDAEVRIRYEVDVKGVTIMKVSFTAKLAGANYTSDISAKTTGFANWLADYKMAMGSAGSVSKSSFAPVSFTRERKKNGKWKGAKTEWQQGSPRINEEGGGEDFASMAKAVDQATLDPLTLLLRQAFNADGFPCTGTHRVYDGRDVFDVNMSGAGPSEGKIDCHIQLNYVAGREVEKAKPDAAKPDEYDITLKEMDAASLGRRIWIPHRIKGAASGQTFVAKATDVDVK
jgi:hypothetical protein